MTQETSPPQRLAKVLAARGVASRREAEKLIAEGRVVVNGAVVETPATLVTDRDHVLVDGKGISPPQRPVYFLFYKPKGTITTRRDPEGRRSVFDVLPDLPARVEAVGRLDMNTEGALLLTNDGELAHRLAHPSSGVPKRYRAKVYRTPSERTLARIEAGITLEDGRTEPCKVRVESATKDGNAWVEITVTEGKNRLVRRIFAAVGHPVSKLTRVSFATISIRGMERGDLRALDGSEISRLRELASGTPASAAGRKGKVRGAGFAKADPEWIAKRTKKKSRVRTGKARGS